MARQAPTPRQLEILSMYARGMGREEIAAELFLAPVTVANHIQLLHERIGTRSLCHAVAVAVACGYLGVDGRRQELYVPALLEDRMAV